MKKSASVLVALLIALPVLGQKKYTMAEATSGLYTSLAVERLSGVSWEPNTNKLYHVVKDGDDQLLLSIDFPSEKVDTVLKKSNTQGLSSLAMLQWLDKGLVYYKKGAQLRKGVMTGAGFQWMDWVKLPEHAAHLTVDKSQNIAYTIDNNLWMITRDGKQLQLTDDENKDIINGQSVHRNEFGINGGIFFSPQGNYLAYYHMDQTMVNDYPIIDWSADPAKAKTIKYPMAGGTSHEVKLRVYNPTTGKTVTINTEGPKDQYLTSITWSPDEEYVYIAVLDRAQKHMALNQYDARTGYKVKTLFEEKNEKYVEPQNPLYFLPGEKDKFVWWSQRDGYMHLYVYNTDGKLVKQLTKGDWLVNEIIGVNKNKKELVITSTKDSPLEKHSYTLNWQNGKMSRIDKSEGYHSASVNDAGTFIYDSYSAANVPGVSQVLSTDSRYRKTLLTAKNTLAEYDRPEVRTVVLSANDGTPLHGRLILPTNFNPKKKYPVIVYLYNGPHVQLVRNRFPETGNLWYELLAQKGYVVFTIDGRGSSNRGLKFEQATFRQLGTVEMDDQLVGVNYLKSLPYVDKDRMGVHGWSFGGFMTTSLMLRHPGVFKVGVAGGPVIDWSMYEIMYTERYMDTPEENPEGYKANNLIDKVGNLEGKLLVIHGAQDDVVVWQHSMKLIRASVKEGKQIDYFVYPAHPHNVRGKDRTHLMQKITDYFDLYLKP
ncbi:MAG: DPP IV N-terminal domain-containing protein [Flavipsychrobacter sp.]